MKIKLNFINLSGLIPLLFIGVFINLSFADSSGDWKTHNTFRRFSRDSLRLVRQWGLKVYCPGVHKSAIKIEALQFTPGVKEKQELSEPTITDFGDRQELSFRLRSFLVNVYDRDQVAVDLMVGNRSYPCFYYQGQKHSGGG